MTVLAYTLCACTVYFACAVFRTSTFSAESFYESARVNTVSALLARNHLGSAVIHAKRRLGNVILFTYTCAFYFQDIALCQTPRDVQEIVLKSLRCGVNQMMKFEKEGNPAAYTGHSI